jgi:hypothetical protein
MTEFDFINCSLLAQLSAKKQVNDPDRDPSLAAWHWVNRSPFTLTETVSVFHSCPEIVSESR